MTKLMKRFLRGDEGATMVEYGLMVALVAIVCIAAVTAMSDGVQAVFNDIGARLSAAV